MKFVDSSKTSIKNNCRVIVTDRAVEAHDPGPGAQVAHPQHEVVVARELVRLALPRRQVPRHRRVPVGDAREDGVVWLL